MSALIDTSLDGHVALCRLNRPDARNALSPELMDELATYWENKRKEYDRPAALTVKRGMRSRHQVKKSPVSRSK